MKWIGWLLMAVLVSGCGQSGSVLGPTTVTQQDNNQGNNNQNNNNGGDTNNQIATTVVITITGTIKNPPQGLVNAVMSIDSLGKTVNTDANGLFALTGVAAGTYTAKFTYPGYDTLSYTIELKEGKQTVCDVGLYPRVNITSFSNSSDGSGGQNLLWSYDNSIVGKSPILLGTIFTTLSALQGGGTTTGAFTQMANSDATSTNVAHVSNSTVQLTGIMVMLGQDYSAKTETSSMISYTLNKGSSTTYQLPTSVIIP